MHSEIGWILGSRVSGDLHEFLQSRCINYFRRHVLFLTDLYRGSVFSALLKANLELRFADQQLSWLVDEQLLSLDPHIWADAAPSCAVSDTRNPGEMDYGKKKSLYYCCKSNEKEHRAAYQMALISPGMQANIHPDVLRPSSYLLWCGRTPSSPTQDPSWGTALSGSLLWKQRVMNSSAIIWHVRAGRLLSAADGFLPLQRLHSSPGKTRQQLHSIRMMLVGEGVCVLSCSHRTHLCVPAYLPLGLAVLEITTPLFSFHEEIFAHAGRNMLSRSLKTVSLKYIYIYICFIFFEGILMVLWKSSKPVCFGRLLLLAFWI